MCLRDQKTISNLVINHEITNKGDNRLENLEWTTYQGNAEHAGSLGLTEKCLPISVRDVDSGIVTKYASIVECARHMGVSKDTINYRVKIGEGRVFPERKQYRASHHDGNWYVPKDIDIDLKRNGTTKSVLVRFILTNQVMEFDKIGDLGNYLNVPAPTLSLWLNQQNQPVLPGYIQLKWAIDSTQWRTITDPYLELDDYTGTRSVKVTNVKTGEVKIYSSGVECANDKGLSTTALHYRLKSNNGSVFSDNCRYCYYSLSV